jgi:hypothetical protein
MLRLPVALTVLFALLLCDPRAMAAGDGKVSCEIMENGKPASGTLVVLHDDKEIARGTCGKPIGVPTGEHVAVLALDGALDAPEQRQPLRVSGSDKAQKLVADFSTGLLEVHITSQGHDTAGMAIIRRDGRQVGTLGSGVSAHLSTGSYAVVARYRAQERRFDTVQIQKDQRTVLNATFE